MPWRYARALTKAWKLRSLSAFAPCPGARQCPPLTSAWQLGSSLHRGVPESYARAHTSCLAHDNSHPSHQYLFSLYHLCPPLTSLISPAPMCLLGAMPANHKRATTLVPPRCVRSALSIRPALLSRVTTMIPPTIQCLPALIPPLSSLWQYYFVQRLAFCTLAGVGRYRLPNTRCPCTCGER